MPGRTQGSEPTRNVLFVVTSLHGGGAEYVGREWMGWLVAHGAVVHVATLSARAPEFTPEGVVHHHVGAATGGIARVAGLRRLLERERFDAVVSLQSYPNLLAIAATASMVKAARPALIVSERNLVALGLPGSSAGHRLKHWMARRTYRRADHVIAVSHPVAAELVAAFGIRAGKVTVVPNPSTAKLDAATAAARSARREQAGGAGAEPIELLVPGRLVEQKRPVLALRVARELLDRGVPVTVRYFGAGPLRDEVVAAAATLGVPTTLAGWVEDWPSRVGPRSVVLLASTREGFGNVLVEATAAGVPVVAVSAALGVGDAVIPGVTGRLSLGADPAEIADEVIAASEIAVPDLDGWLAHFSPETSGRALSGVLERVLDRAAANDSGRART